MLNMGIMDLNIESEEQNLFSLYTRCFMLREEVVNMPSH